MAGRGLNLEAGERRGLDLDAEEVAASAGLAQLFALYLVVLNLSLRPTAEQWREADPILTLAPPWLVLWLAPGLSLAAAAAWLTGPWPARRIWRRATVLAACGLAVGALACGGLRMIVGPTMPGFFPSEESARPGFLLSMTAGYGEEVIFRLALLPVLFFVLGRRFPRPAAALLASAVTALAFAALHELGGAPSSPAFFLTRALLPGFAMSLAALAVGPSFIIAAHGSAHILIPALFA